MYFKYTEYLIGPTVTKFKGTISAAIDASKSQLSYFLLVQKLTKTQNLGVCDRFLKTLD